MLKLKTNLYKPTSHSWAMKKFGPKKEEIKKYPESLLGKIWYFLWKDDSIWSWIASLILAFILVKFVFFPFLSFIFQSPMPLVVVESSSMFHSGGLIKDVTGFGTQDDVNQWWKNAKSWYEGNSIQYEQIKTWSFKSGLDKGDIIVIKGSKNLKAGDIIVFNAGQQHPIIHRIVKIHLTEQGAFYETKGDNYATNSNQLAIEKEIKPEQIVGKAVFRIPKLGWIKLIVVQTWNSLK